MSKSEKLAWSLVGMFVGMPVTWIIRGFVLAKLWLWFVASQFGLPALNIPQAIGAGMLLNLVTFHYTKPVDDEPVGAPLVRSLILSMFALGIGSIVALFL